MRVVVTGANRGIGLELVRQLIARGDQVDATVRDPDAAEELRALKPTRIHRVDVTDGKSIAALANAITEPVDVVINDAGTNGGPRQAISKMTEPAARADILDTFDVNAVGPLRVSLALLPHVRRGTGKKLVHVTSGMGSIADNGSGGYYAYRMSKAALNMASKSLAVDLKGDGILSVVINPGWVQTAMGGPNAPTSVADSVTAILARIDEVTIDDSGAFLNWNGKRYPW